VANDKDDDRDPKKVKAAAARAKALTPERRAEIGRMAAVARWGGDLPEAAYEGSFPLAGVPIACAVLPNGTRIITQATFLRALGRSRSPKAGTGVLSTVDQLPFFLAADALKPFISEDLVQSTNPVFYRTQSGGKGMGYDARLLPQVADVYLQMRDAALQERGSVPARYQSIVRAADMLVRGLANVGIIALVDEATGYQEVRDKHALQAILDSFLRKELAAWAKRFPDEFYEHIFRLRGWKWKGRGVNPPQVVAHYTKDIVYHRLAPGLLAELEKRNPITESGRRKTPHTQWLTQDVGDPALAQHLHAVITLRRVTPDGGWDTFLGMLNIAHPKRSDTMQYLKAREPKSQPPLDAESLPLLKLLEAPAGR
jgi:hypothetical protein